LKLLFQQAGVRWVAGFYKLDFIRMKQRYFLEIRPGGIENKAVRDRAEAFRIFHPGIE
jgi:hypothetical protein